jgi:thiaminase
MPNEPKKRRPREMIALPSGHNVSRSLHNKLLAVREELTRLNEVERLNFPDIAARLGVTRETAATYAELLGIKVHNSYSRPRVDKKNWAKVLPPLRATGMTYEQIGAKIGATKISVCRWFLNQGIVTNDHYRNA